ncbi:MAG: hypothetical protein HY235_18800 [Acidobacteria bacterium]|nr:hypothetical protein [Acidobacteriota bacterium]
MSKTLAVCVVAAACVWADDISGSNAGKLAFLIPGLYGPAGLTLPNQEHVAHFDSAFRASFGPFNAAIASQLTSLPIPSPASGFVYSFDKTLGVATRSAQSFGPILAERAETIGKEKFYFGVAYQSFRFKSMDGIPLRRMPAVFEHGVAANPEFQKDIITTDNFLDISIGQVTSYFTYGLADRLDVSVAVPVISAALTAVSSAKIQRIGTKDDTSIHFFPTTVGDRSQQQFSGQGSAAGLGDVVVRLKGTLVRRSSSGFALGLDVRAPTGDEYDFLGTGAAGVKPFVALSFRAGKVSPHLNAGYQWNGKSVLAGNVVSGDKAKLPNEFSYAAGADIGVGKRFTVAGDLLGLARPGAERLGAAQYRAANNLLYPNIAFARKTLSQHNAALGFKINGAGNFLVAFNLLFKLNDDGLRGRVTPLIGVSYTF